MNFLIFYKKFAGVVRLILGTSPDEGLGICFAACEELIHLRSFTFFATHFSELCRLDMYPGVEKLVQLKKKKIARNVSHIHPADKYIFPFFSLGFY